MAMNRGRIASILGVALALFAALAISAQPASAASGHEIDRQATEPETARCAQSTFMQCLFWYGDRTSGAWWGTSNNDGNLGDNYFFSGSGTGAGHVVRNNAAGMDCDYYAELLCDSYYSPNYAGNFDYAYRGYGGVLYFTWNDEASVAFY